MGSVEALGTIFSLLYHFEILSLLRNFRFLSLLNSCGKSISLKVRVVNPLSSKVFMAWGLMQGNTVSYFQIIIKINQIALHRWWLMCSSDASVTHLFLCHTILYYTFYNAGHILFHHFDVVLLIISLRLNLFYIK